MEDVLAPDTVTVAITREDGGVTVMKVITAEYAWDKEQGVRVCTQSHDPTPEYIEELIAKRYEPAPGHPFGVWSSGNGKRAVSWRFVADDYGNEDRTYRNAWKDAPGRSKPDHDMPKAREIHRAYLRRARLAEFCRLDHDYRLADEANDQAAKKTIGTERQKFRDVTEDPRIEAAQTVEELKALRLDVLLPETVGEHVLDRIRVNPAINTERKP